MQEFFHRDYCQIWLDFGKQNDPRITRTEHEHSAERSHSHGFVRVRVFRG
jgi:hypothetical protein